MYCRDETNRYYVILDVEAFCVNSGPQWIMYNGLVHKLLKDAHIILGPRLTPCPPSGLLQTENAMSLLREMRAAPGVRTNMSVYSALIAAYCRSGDWAAALGLLEDARKEQHKPATGDFRMSLKVRSRRQGGGRKWTV